MGRNLSPMLQQQLKNLDKDTDSRKSAMEALSSYVKDLDSKAIPIFLASVSDTKDTGLTSGEYTISLYGVLARVHGTKIVPQIDNIMSTIIKTLKSSTGSFALHQACSKVVPAIARYGIDPTTPDDKKRRVIRSLCKPLADSLLASQESLSSGAALCLTALVDSNNWCFASSEMVNEVCQKVVGALEKPMQTNSHIGLVMSLAERNSLVVEAYAGLLIRSGIKILNANAVEGNCKKRLVAIQMISFLMKSLDYKCILSELSFVIKEMDKWQGDHTAYVKGAAFEAMETAKRILTEKGSRFKQRSGRRGNGDLSPFTASSESQTKSSFDGYSCVLDSPVSTQGVEYDRSVNRKLWRYANGGVDVSLKDGLFSGTSASVVENSERNGFSEDQGDYAEGFSGFSQKSSTNGGSRSATPSPQRSYIHPDNIKIFTTPRKLIKSLQVPDELSENQSIISKAPLLTDFDLNPTSKYDQNGLSSDLSNHSTHEGEQYHHTSESVSSTTEIPQELACETKARHWLYLHAFRILSAIILLFSVIMCFLLVGDPYDDYNLVPT